MIPLLFTSNSHFLARAHFDKIYKELKTSLQE